LSYNDLINENVSFMKIPIEIRDQIIAFSVSETSIYDTWNEFPGIKWGISENPKLDWEKISRKTLSEEFISSFRDRVDWFAITVYQDLSEEFISRFENLLYKRSTEVVWRLSHLY
jgi:hypothetical protein